MTSTGGMPLAAGWLLTYLIHSTVLLGLAWMALRNRRVHPEVVDLVWKVALLGGLVTASVQTGLDLRPAGTVHLGTTRPATVEPAPAMVHPLRMAGVSEGSAPEAGWERVRDGQTTERRTGVEAARAPRLPVAEAEGNSVRASAASAPSIAGMAVGLWLVVASLLLVAYLGRRLVLVGRLGDRRWVSEGALPLVLDRLQREAGVRQRVRLTASGSISSPVALGTREICLPSAALDELEPRQQRAMLAHELAHLVRRDPHWLMTACLVERIFFFQPLNRLARRGMQEAAEYLADDWAARHTGGVALARCLVTVAEWIQASPLGVPVAGLAGERSQLSTRVTRLLEAEAGASEGRRRLWVPSAVALVSLACLVAFVPGVSGRGLSEPTPSALQEGVPTGAPGPHDADDAGWAAQEEPEVEDRLEESEPDHVEFLEDMERSVETAGHPSPASAPGEHAAGSTQHAARPTQPPADTAIVRALMERLNDTDVGVRQAAAQALGRLEEPMAIPALVDALEDEDPGVRRSALHALSDFDSGVPPEPIRGLLSASDPDVRVMALRVLGDLEDRTSVDAISRLVSDSVPDVRRQVVRALEEIGDVAAVPALRTAMRDTDPNVRISALRALDDMDQALDESVIRQALGEDDRDLRRTAIRIAGDRKMTALSGQVAELLSDPDPDTRVIALRALDEMGTEVSEAAVTRALSDTSADLRRMGLRIAEDRRMTSLTPAIVRLLDDASGDVRTTAARALTEMRTEAARSALQEAMTHEDAEVRRIAVRYFGEQRDR